MKFPDNSYKQWLESIKQKIRSTQLKIAINANSQLLELYWQLAEEIVRKQQTATWGDSVMDQLSMDLKISFPSINGFLRRNLYAIRQWYLFYRPMFEFVPQAVAQIPWVHHRLLISKVKTPEVALFYCNATLEHGWNRDNLELAIKNDYFSSKGKSITNFSNTLPEIQSGLAVETLKNTSIQVLNP